MPSTFESALQELIRRSIRDLGLSPESEPQLPVSVEIPRIRAHGDLATSVALQLASRQGRSPMEVAQALATRLERNLKESPLKSDIEKVEFKPPGFINLFLHSSYLYQVLRDVLQQGPEYGRSSLGQGQKGLVEFVSANPTGPLSVAHGRQAAVGDALTNLLEFAGYQVRREYYLNDEGTQIDLLGASILARAREKLGFSASFPENGYKGAYITALGEAWVKQKGAAAVDQPNACDQARDFGVGELTRVIQTELESFGVRFDRWFPQSSLKEKGYLVESLELLKKRGFLYEAEGAWWLKSTAFGDDKDRVVVRSDGRMTYIAADIAYHRRKFEEGYTLLVNLWGPDHHGYIPRLKAAVQALGFPAEQLQIRIVQLCTLKRGAETIPMSTREGIFITLTQVIQEVGIDAARFFFLLRKSDAHLEFDLELAKRQSPENPVYYIQYAHARIANILAYQRGQTPAPRGQVPARPRPGAPWDLTPSADHSLLVKPEELTLLRHLREFPGAVEMSVRALEPFGVVSYLQGLAEAFHRFYDVHRVVSDDAALTSARLGLAKGVQIVLATGLRLLGVSAPDKM